VAHALALLREAADAHGGRIVQATSLGVEGMVITDLIARHKLPMVVATLDTGALHAETLALIPRIEARYGIRVERYAPRPSGGAASCAARRLAMRQSVDCARPAARCASSSRCSACWRATTPGSPGCAASSRTTAATCRSRARRRRPRQVLPAGRLEPGRRLALRATHDVPYNELHDQGFPSIGCPPAPAPWRPARTSAPAAGGGNRALR
jgi:phosphoadenosine phosphosulfate reductase